MANTHGTHGSYQIKSEVVNRAKPIMVALAVLGWVGSIISYFSNPDQFFSAYLFGYFYWVSLSIGATFFVMIQRQTQAEWSVVVRRLAETVMTHFWIYEGTLDGSGQVLTLDCQGPSFANPNLLVHYQDIFAFEGEDRRVLTSRLRGADGQWTQFMRAEYRRVG